PWSVVSCNRCRFVLSPTTDCEQLTTDKLHESLSTQISAALRRKNLGRAKARNDSSQKNTRRKTNRRKLGTLRFPARCGGQPHRMDQRADFQRTLGRKDAA